MAFLGALLNPCAALETGELAGLGAKLPDVVDTLRFVWLHCPTYGGSERITGLFRTVSVTVIARCVAAIDLDDLFTGDLARLAASLATCLKVCTEWKAVYRERKELAEFIMATAKPGSHDATAAPWIVSDVSIFAQVSKQ